MERIKILVIDDTPSMRAFVKAAIKTSFPGDVMIDEAASGEVGKEKLSATFFDVVICDWNMPGMKGTELLEWMKGQDNLKDVPFLMLTAHNEKDIVMTAINAGVFDYVMKPVSVETLSKKLNAAIRTALSVRIDKTDGENIS
jgi:DNA-binding response OmpR family regulator